MTVVCVDVPGCEGGAVLATAPGGTVIFFSMATSFSAAALGAEGVAADVTMLVGNGYVPGHAELALGPDPVRARGPQPVRGPAGRVRLTWPHHDQTDDVRQPRSEGLVKEVLRVESRLRLDPAMVAEARELARVAGQPIVDLATRHTTVSVERAVLRLAGLEGADAAGCPG